MNNIDTIWRKVKDYFSPLDVPKPYNYTKSFEWYVTLYSEYKKQKSKENIKQ